MDIHNIDSVPAFTTKDGSEIRELLAHRNSCIAKQSLAEARLLAWWAQQPEAAPPVPDGTEPAAAVELSPNEESK